MPYIAFDLDALKHVPDMARAAGCREDVVGYGLVRLWAWCWTEKREDVTDTHLRGFFGADVGAVLEAFGHLAGSPSGWRVRGAEKYLRIARAQRESGKNHAVNLNQGSRGGIRGGIRDPSGDPSGAPPPDGSPGPARLLPPTTDDRAPKEALRASVPEPAAAKAEKPAKPPDPRLRPLTERLVADFLAVRGVPYVHQGAKDAQALKRLLAVLEPDAISAGWRAKLACTGFYQVNTLAELPAKINAPAAGPPAPRSGPKTEAEKDAESRAKHGVIPGVNAPCTRMKLIPL